MISWEIAASVVVVTVVSCAEKLTEYILSQNLPLCFFPGAAFDVDGKKNSSGANIDQFAVCQLFVLAVNLDLACPLSFGKKHRRDLTNKSITGRTLVEEHWEKSSQLPHQLLAVRLSRPTCGQADND